MSRPYYLLDFVALILPAEAYKLWSSSLCSSLQPPVTSYPLGPNILLSTLFLDILNWYSSLSVRDKVSHTQKTAGKIIFLYILFCTFFEDLKMYRTIKFTQIWWVSETSVFTMRATAFVYRLNGTKPSRQTRQQTFVELNLWRQVRHYTILIRRRQRQTTTQATKQNTWT
jgi:hypothetical protein